MFDFNFIIFLFSGFLFSFVVLFLVYKWVQSSVIKEARNEADEITKDAQDQFNQEEQERLERSQEIELELWSKVEEAHLNIEEKCTDLDDQIQSRKKLYEEKDKLGRQALMQNENEMRTLSMSLSDSKMKLEQIQKKHIEQQSEYQKELIIKTGLSAEDVLDHRLNSRTVLMNPILRFIYWNMNYHVEHHMFPMVPYHQLPKLYEDMKPYTPAANTSVIDAYREIIPALLRQAKDPSYAISRKLPDGVAPMTEPIAAQ